MTVQLALVDRRPRRRSRRRAYHRRVVDGARGRAFIGRTVESERLAGDYARAAGGESRMVVVAGEAGIGKTRLVDAFGEQVAAGGGRLLVGGCLPLGTGGLPYAPFVEAFRTLLRDVDPGALPALLGPDRGELARIMPEVRPRPDRYDEASAGFTRMPAEATTDDRFAQSRLFELVLGVLERVARLSPVVLVIEDLQWADPSTRDLLAFLVRNLREERVLLLATLRTDELDPRHPVMVLLAELERSDRVDRIDLARFGRDDLARLLADELGGAPVPELVDRIWERTDGNPFYAEQILAVTRETSDDELPPRLRDVVLARVSAVSEAGQEVLRVASAAGTRIDDELLGAVAGLPVPVLREALREVVDRRILVPAGGVGDPHFVFCHALLQEVIHGELFPGERARLHGRYAAALEARAVDRAAGGTTSGPAPTPAELAYHWDAAGDERRALAAIDRSRSGRRAWLRVARREPRVSTGPSALGSRPRTRPTTPRRPRVEILVRAAETAVLIGEYRAAVGFGQRSHRQCRPGDGPGRAATLHERQRWYLWEAGDRAGCRGRRRRGGAAHPDDTAVRRPSPDPRAARGDPPVRRPLRGIDPARRGGDRGRPVGRIGVGRGARARHPRLRPRVRSGGSMTASSDSARGSPSPKGSRAPRGSRWVPRTSRSCSTASGGRGRRSTSRSPVGNGHANSASSGPTAGCCSRSRQRRRSRSGAGTMPIGSSAWAFPGTPSACPGSGSGSSAGGSTPVAGDLPEAAVALAAARAADEAAGGTDDRGAILAALAELAAVQGHVTETRAAVAEGLRMATVSSPDPALAQLAASGLRVEADAAAAARARRDTAGLDDARLRAGLIGTNVERIAAILGVPDAEATSRAEPSRDIALTALCRAEARRVEERDTATGWATVAAAWDAIGRPYPTAYARFRVAATILRERGSRVEARAALTEARSTAVRLGARTLLAEIERLARQARLELGPAEDALPADRPAGPDGAALGLTERELEVLRLLAAGWSNQEIADALFISRKTASVHASHIFDKLGAANRVEAAAIARRLGLAGDAPSPPGSVGASH